MNELATTGGGASLPMKFNEKQMDIIKKQIMPGAKTEELAFFSQICQRTQLDPFARQIFAVPRKTKNRQTGQYETKWTIQTSVDGFRLIAERSGKYEGQAETMWCGEDGVWSDVWLHDKPPAAAKVGVFKAGQREATWAVATFKSYKQTDYNGNLSGLWKKMPEVMLAKCAECLALRKAFPNELSGLYTKEEMDQAETPPARPTMSEDVEPKMVNAQIEKKTQVPPAPTPETAATVPTGEPDWNEPIPNFAPGAESPPQQSAPPQQSEEEDYKITPKQKSRLFAISRSRGYKDAQVRELMEALCGVTSTSDLTKNPYDFLVNYIQENDPQEAFNDGPEAS